MTRLSRNTTAHSCCELTRYDIFASPVARLLIREGSSLFQNFPPSRPLLTLMNCQRHKLIMSARFFRMFFSSSYLHPWRTDAAAHGSSYGRRDLYNLVADVNSYPSFLPYCTSSRILEQRVDQDGVVTMDAELMIGFFAFKESYVSRVTCRPYEFVQVSSSHS
jgi:hypothetical protein